VQARQHKPAQEHKCNTKLQIHKNGNLKETKQKQQTQENDNISEVMGQKPKTRENNDKLVRECHKLMQNLF
jgi:hypothetical protein